MQSHYLASLAYILSSEISSPLVLRLFEEGEEEEEEVGQGFGGCGDSSSSLVSSDAVKALLITTGLRIEGDVREEADPSPGFIVDFPLEVRDLSVDSEVEIYCDGKKVLSLDLFDDEGTLKQGDCGSGSGSGSGSTSTGAENKLAKLTAPPPHWLDRVGGGERRGCKDRDGAGWRIVMGRWNHPVIFEEIQTGPPSASPSSRSHQFMNCQSSYETCCLIMSQLKADDELKGYRYVPKGGLLKSGYYSVSNRQPLEGGDGSRGSIGMGDKARNALIGINNRKMREIETTLMCDVVEERGGGECEVSGFV